MSFCGRDVKIDLDVDHETTVLDIRRSIKEGLILDMSGNDAEKYAIRCDGKVLNNSNVLSKLVPDRSGEINLLIVTGEGFKFGMYYLFLYFLYFCSPLYLPCTLHFIIIYVV